MTRVSVVVPTFNQSQYLLQCLDSIWHQDYPDLEIVVVNDGSPDNTSDLLQQFQEEIRHDIVSYACYYEEKSDRVKRCLHDRHPKSGRTLNILEHSQNRGLATALNTGFKNCSGTYVTYVPSDNICYPNLISELVLALETEDVDFAYADMLIFDDHGRIKRKFSLPDYSFSKCFADWYLCGVAKLYRASLHAKHGYYDEHLLAHDHELYLRFALAGVQFTHVPKALMGVREHAADREVHIHAPENWNRLIEESKDLVRIARQHEKG